MMHDKLITKILSYNKDEGSAIALGDVNNALYALLRVVELHVPHEITLPDGNWGLTCMRCIGVYYPCKTIEEIEKKLYD